jgi:hypothetical protein
MVEGRGGKERCSFRTRTGANLYGGRAGWRMLGWVAVIACYWTSATLLAHVPEPIVLHGGRAGWKRTVSFRTRTGANSYARWKGGVGKNSVLCAHVPEPIVCKVEGRAGKERCSFRTRIGAKEAELSKVVQYSPTRRKLGHACGRPVCHKVQNPDPYKNVDPGVRK